MKRFLFLSLVIPFVFNHTAEAKDLSRMKLRDRIRYFVENGGGLLKESLDSRRASRDRWINIQVREALPPTFDLRKLHPSGHLQPIRTQKCGDCWAHSVIAAVESKWALEHPNEPFAGYSHQEMISTCSGTGGSCNGGYFKAFNYVTGKSGAGLPLEKDLPYLGKTTPCTKAVEKKRRAVEWAFIGDPEDSRGPSIEQMKEALLQYGSLSVSLKAFNLQGSGVYTACAYGETNHMTNVEGWVDDPAYHGGGYWIMRNSWGNRFGENGYGKVAFKDILGRKCANLGENVAVITKLE